MSRWKASFIHLLISILVVGSVAAYIVYFWYPPALIHMAKADRLLMLIGGVDLVVGPLLTLIVYKAGKAKLKLDLAVIGFIQLAFLAYGLYTTWNSRPVFLVAVPDRFELVFANEITPERLAEAKIEKYRQFGFTKPVLVASPMPDDYKLRDDIMNSSISGQGDIQNMPKYFINYTGITKRLLTHAKPITEGKDLDAHEFRALKHAAMSYGRKIDDLRYLTLASSRGYAVMLVEAESGKVVGPANVDP
jgi:hypothetical protein